MEVSMHFFNLALVKLLKIKYMHLINLFFNLTKKLLSQFGSLLLNFGRVIQQTTYQLQFGLPCSNPRIHFCLNVIREQPKIALVCYWGGKKLTIHLQFQVGVSCKLALSELQNFRKSLSGSCVKTYSASNTAHVDQSLCITPDKLNRHPNFGSQYQNNLEQIICFFSLGNKPFPNIIFPIL